MKKIFFAALLLLSSAVLYAQPYIDINNNIPITNAYSPANVFVTVYAISPSCGEVVDNTVPVVAPMGFTQIDLSVAVNWNSGSVPSSYDIGYVIISRDPSCPLGGGIWGTNTGPYSGASLFIDEAIIGDPSCGYSNINYFYPDSNSGTGTPSSCGGLIAGMIYGVQISFPGGSTAAQIDIN